MGAEKQQGIEDPDLELRHRVADCEVCEAGSESLKGGEEEGGMG